MRSWLMSISFVLLTACAADESSSVDTPSRGGGSRGVGQPGPQDIAYLRSLIEDGDVPAPSLLDQVGLFAEDALEQPPAACGRSVCAHPMLAVAPRFDPGTWTMAFVSLNSAVDPATRPREPVHVVLAVDNSPAAQATIGGTALNALVAGLAQDDRVSLVSYGNGARIVLEGASPADVPSLAALFFQNASATGGPADLYAGLAAASDALRAPP